MARTKQTARKTFGGPTPRNIIARKRLTSKPFSASENRQVQVEIFNNSGTRTIVVEGTAEFCVVPDSIVLSFRVREEAESLTASLVAMVGKIKQIRSVAASCDVPNENVVSDSISSSSETLEYRVYHGEGSDSDGNKVPTVTNTLFGVKRDHPMQTYRVDGIKTIHTSQSVVRIYLEGPDAAEQFSKVSLSLFSAGFTCHEAPVYESTNINEERNTARTEACENALVKASSIVKAMGDNSAVVLGRPISITDVHCDTQDDADASFLGSSNAKPSKIICGSMPAVEEAEAVDASAMVENASDIFVVTPLRIVACVLVIFELQSAPSAST